MRGVPPINELLHSPPCCAGCLHYMQPMHLNQQRSHMQEHPSPMCDGKISPSGYRPGVGAIMQANTHTHTQISGWCQSRHISPHTAGQHPSSKSVSNGLGCGHCIAAVSNSSINGRCQKNRLHRRQHIDRGGQKYTWHPPQQHTPSKKDSQNAALQAGIHVGSKQQHPGLNTVNMALLAKRAHHKRRHPPQDAHSLRPCFQSNLIQMQHSSCTQMPA